MSLAMTQPYVKVVGFEPHRLALDPGSVTSYLGKVLLLSERQFPHL